MNNRERFSSRLGFILISAGCAVGLGNVWRFPYITGQYGGAAFVLVYLIFLVLLGLPIMVMEFAVGRASQKSAARSFHVLEPSGTKWHLQGYACMAGNYLLMMFYTTVGGWMAAYIFKTLTGEFKGLDSDGVAAVFNDMLARPGYMTFWMVLVVLLSFFICSLGLQKGVERITKAMMSCLFLILLILCIRSVTLPGASEGLRFYLIPDFTRFTENGVGNTIFAAMGQAFFTLSLGIGAMAIFGSYIDKQRSLTGESIHILLLDYVSNTLYPRQIHVYEAFAEETDASNSFAEGIKGQRCEKEKLADGQVNDEAQKTAQKNATAIPLTLKKEEEKLFQEVLSDFLG